MSQYFSIYQLKQTGVSIWLDYLSKTIIENKVLDTYLNDYGITGITTNPSIFNAAITQNNYYDSDIKQLLLDNPSITTSEILLQIMIKDVSAACEKLKPYFNSTNGIEGKVSIEIDPKYAHDKTQTISQAKFLWEKINKPNLLIKVPATDSGISALETIISLGISVNATLIFSPNQYEKVIQAYIRGLAQANIAGLDLSKIHSVASIFISRIDTKVDAELTKLSDTQTQSLLGNTGIANAYSAYEKFQTSLTSNEFKKLTNKGANIQRPLWASTEVKNPNYPVDLYISNLLLPNTINTIPENTLKAIANLPKLQPNNKIKNIRDSTSHLDAIQQFSIKLEKIYQELEAEGIDKFIDAWNNLLKNINSKFLSK